MMERTPRQVDTVVIGAGQAGLTMGYYLAAQKCDFVILDASERVGDSWRTRWDSLRLFTPARYNTLPDMAFPASEDYYPTKDEMADYLEAYADRFDLPVQLATTVTSLSWNGTRYVLETDAQRVLANHVVMATGALHHPNIPDVAAQLDSAITHYHSSSYKNPEQLPNGDVLVVGAGNSGAEIAIELAAMDRHIYLSGRDTGHIPLSVFNNSVVLWMAQNVLTVDTWVGRKLKERLQAHGDPVIRLRSKDIRQAGVERVSRTEGVTNGKPCLADGQVLDVAAVVWATGFRPDYSWVELPRMTLGDDGFPVHHRGVVNRVPGLYVMGLIFQYALLPTISGLATDARYIVDHLLTAETEHAYETSGLLYNT